MKMLYLIIALMLAATNINAQNFWERVPGDIGGLTLTAMSVNSDNHIYAGFAGSSTAGVMYSTNDGDSWLSISPNRDIISLSMNGNGDIYVGYRNFSSADSVFRTTDNGNSWTLIFVEDGINGLVINQLNGNVFIGSNNGIYRSVNNGNSWTQVQSGECALLAVAPNGYLFANLDVQGVPKFYRSVNNGTSWTVIDNGLVIDPAVYDGVHVTSITISNNGVIYIYAVNVETYKGVFRSGSNDSSWSKRNNGLPDDFVYSFTTNSLGHVFAGVAPPNKVYRSANSGQSWHSVSGGLPTFGGPVFTLAVNLNDRLFAGNGGFYRTTLSTTSQTFLDSLKNINTPINHISPSVTIIHIPGPSGSIPKQHFSPNVESVEISIDEVLHTRTGDLTFTLEHNGVTVTLISEAGGNGQDFISTLLSDDAEELITNGTAPFTGFYKPEQSLSVFKGMDPYGDWTLTITDGYENNDGILNGWSLQIMLDSPISNIEDEAQTIPSSYGLEQNYPNPFNPATSMQYAIGSRQFVTLKVYDLLGREVVTLVNEEKPAGHYKVSFDASGLTSGIYFYQLQTSTFSETKKMVLIR